MKNFIVYFLIAITTFIIADTDYQFMDEQEKSLEKVEKIENGKIEEIENQNNKVERTFVEQEIINTKPTIIINSNPDLYLTPDTMFQRTPNYVKTMPTYKIIGLGLMRGFVNMTTCAGELARGVTYEVSAKPWYVSIISWLPVGIGGTMSRMCAGFADIFTLGYFGDIMLAPDYPDYVWQGDWLYHAKPITRTKNEIDSDKNSRNNRASEQLSPEIRSKKVINSTAPLR